MGVTALYNWASPEAADGQHQHERTVNEFLWRVLISHTHIRAGLSRKEIVANSIIFVIAGFENSKMLLTFLCYNLAMHKDCQDRLRKEIQDGIAAHEVSKIRGKRKQEA